MATRRDEKQLHGNTMDSTNHPNIKLLHSFSYLLRSFIIYLVLNELINVLRFLGLGGTVSPSGGIN